MSASPFIDETLVRRLPVPLARLYRRAHNAKTSSERHDTAFYLWEASLKLLSTTAVVTYADVAEHSPQIVERLTNLARPSIGHWWEFLRLLVPELAEAGDGGFLDVRDLLLGHRRADMAHVAGLDSTLLEVLKGTQDAGSVVRLSEFFDRMVQYRNREVGHGAVGLRSAEFHDRMGRTLLIGMAELLNRIDVLAGRRLVYIADISRLTSGNWLIDWYDLTGETAQRCAPVELTANDARSLLPQRVYLVPREATTRNDVTANESVPRFISASPLVTFEPDTGEFFFLNARRGLKRVEYLCYDTGRVIEGAELLGEQREMLANVLGVPVRSEEFDQWSAKSIAEEPPVEETREPSIRRLGEFELLSELGRGGMGVVYRAWQPSLGRQVAVKCLLHTGDPKAEARFRREIRALGHVDHRHLVKIFSSGTDGDRWFYAMELLEGATLAAVCDSLTAIGSTADQLNVRTWHDAVSTACSVSRSSEKKLSESEELAAEVAAVARPAATDSGVAEAREKVGVSGSRSYIDRVVELVGQTCEATHALHEAGVVHRDIKPGNIVLSVDSSEAVLMDLGLAQLADEADGKLTRTRQFVGTLRYASPEQIMAVQSVDRRSDIYSTGVTLWELLTLRPMFNATEQTPTPELMQRIQYEEPESIRKYNPAVPRDLEAIVLKCLEKDPKRRYETARELGDDLQRFLNRELVHARPVGVIGKAVRRARRRPGRSASIIVAVILSTFCLWYWDAYYRLKTEHYANIVLRFQVPEGIGRLSKAQTSRRNLTWKFYRRGGMVERIEAINGCGQLSTSHEQGAFLRRDDDASRICAFEYVRDENDRLLEERALDRFGAVVWKFRVTWTPDGSMTGSYQNAKGLVQARGGTGAAHVHSEFTEDGFERENRFLDANGNPQLGGEVRVFGYRRAYNDLGQCHSLQFLDENGEVTVARTGLSGWEAVYDDLGNVTAQFFLGHDGVTRTLHADGNAGWRAVYDKFGNEKKRTFTSTDGQPTLVVGGFAGWTTDYDRRGNRKQVCYFNEKEEPTLHADGNAGWTAEYDKSGNEVERTFISKDGQPTLVTGGFAGWTAKFDERSNQIEMRYFDEKKHRTLHADGEAGWNARHDKSGNIIEMSFVGLNGTLKLQPGGFAKWTADYDAQGNQIEQRYFNEHGKPTVHNDGEAGWTAKYDERGNQTEMSFFGRSDEPKLQPGGFAKWTADYDAQGNQIEQRYFNEHGKPTVHNDGEAGWTAKYDERGNQTEMSFFGLDDELKLQPDGYARWTAEYNLRGNQIAKRFLGADGHVTRTRSGHAKITWQYDERGNQTEQAWFDERDEPAFHPDGYVRATAVYDERGRRVASTCFGPDRMPIKTPDGYCTWKAKYDDQGNEIENRYFGTDDELTLSSEGIAGYRSEFDAHGREVSRIFFGVNEEPRPHEHGFAAWTATHDAMGRQTTSRHFDTEGRPVLCHENDAGWDAEYDESGKLTGKTWFGIDADGKLFPNQVLRYDARDNVTSKRHLGSDGKPQLCGEGDVGWDAEYDESGKLTGKTWFGIDADGKLFPNQVLRYDARDNVTSKRHLGSDGKPQLCGEGDVGWDAEYDEDGKLTGKTSFGIDANGKLFPNQVLKYDIHENVTSKRHLGSDGKPQLCRKGDVGWDAEYDDNGSLIAKSFFRITDNGTMYVKRKTTYDETGEEKDVTEYDEAGNQVETSENVLDALWQLLQTSL